MIITAESDNQIQLLVELPVLLYVKAIRLVGYMRTVFQHIMLEVLHVSFESDADRMIPEFSRIIQS